MDDYQNIKNNSHPKKTKINNSKSESISQEAQSIYARYAKPTTGGENFSISGDSAFAGNLANASGVKPGGASIAESSFATSLTAALSAVFFKTQGINKVAYTLQRRMTRMLLGTSSLLPTCVSDNLAIIVFDYSRHYF